MINVPLSSINCMMSVVAQRYQQDFLRMKELKREKKKKKENIRAKNMLNTKKKKNE